MYKGVATITLDYGKCPRWLFERMVSLSQEIIEVMVTEYGPDEFIKRIADPVWFQSLGTVLAFDWNASGLTTILTAALKEAIKGHEKDLGIFICGGKGKTSRKTPDEILLKAENANLTQGDANNLIYNSKMAAKIDSSLIQDGYQIYHHAFFFTKNGAWTVIQQGMNTKNQTARRYHWHSKNVKDLICEPHTGIISDTKQKNVLNLTSQKSENNRNLSTELVQGNYYSLIRDINLLRKYSSDLGKMLSFRSGNNLFTFLNLEPVEFDHHPVELEDFSKSKYLEKILFKLTDEKPENYEVLLATEGVGPKTIRALALVAELIYGAKPSYKDPARYSFAHGGKDATPYPVDRATYDENIRIMKKIVEKSKIPISEKRKILNQFNQV